MMANGALMFVLLGAGLRSVLSEPRDAPTRLRYRAGQGLALLAALIGIATLAEHLFGLELGIDLWLFSDPAASAFYAIPGRPAYPVALGGLGIGLGIVLIDVEVRHLWLSELLAVTTMQVAVLGLIGHIFGVQELYGTSGSMPGTGMAVHAAAGFLILSIGLLGARANRGLMAVLRSGTPGGMLVRRWLPVPVLVLLLMGIVYFALQRTLGVDPAVGSWSLFMTSLTVLTGAVWGTAEVLHRAGLERDAAQRVLEERVRERTAELHQANQALNAAGQELAQVNHRLEKTVEERTRHLQDTIRSLETVCYNIAHDLRAPNRAIAGFAEALTSMYGSSLDADARDSLRRIAAAAQRSDALTLDLLAYGRLGHADLPCSKQCLRTRLQNVLEKLANDIAAARASIEVSEPLPDLWANPAALDQVLSNLVTNGMKFVAPGVRPQVKVHAEDAGEWCRVVVEDNGIGIPPEHQQRIFGVFQRLHPTDKYSGSGIGLAIVQKSVERMGGKVGVKSSIGNGSCFWFELRRA
jgi:signal transduction histidine kinase